VVFRMAGGDDKHNREEKESPRRERRKRQATRSSSCRRTGEDGEHPTTPGIRGALTLSDTVPQPPGYLWTSRSPDVTCLSFQLDPMIPAQRKIICQNCLNFFDVVLKFILAHKDNEDKRRSNHSKRYTCYKPWFPHKAEHKHGGKQDNMYDFHAFFHENAAILASAGSISSPPSTAATAAAVISTSPPEPPQVKAKTKTKAKAKAKETTDTAEKSEAEAEVIVTDKSKEVILDENLVISKDIVSSIKEAFEQRDMDVWPLQEHELDLLQLLALSERRLVLKDKVLPIQIAREVTSTLTERDFSQRPLLNHEQGILQLLVVSKNTILKQATDIIKPALLNKKNGSPLEEHESRLLGQLAFKAFKVSKSEEKLPLNSFKQLMKFEISKVPGRERQRARKIQNVCTRSTLQSLASGLDICPRLFPTNLLLIY